MSAVRATVLGTVFGCIVYALYVSRFQPAEVNSFRSFVRKEVELIHMQLPSVVSNTPMVVESSASEKRSSPEVSLPTQTFLEVVDRTPKYSIQSVSFLSQSSPAVEVPSQPEPQPSSITDDPVASRCTDLKTTYSVVPGSSWGTLTLELQGEWTKLKCDLHVKNSSTSTSKVLDHLEALPVPATVAHIDKKKSKGNRKKKGHKGEEAGLVSISGDSLEWCRDTMERYQVLPMKSWGQAPGNIQDAWMKRDCDAVFTRERMSKRPVSRCNTTLIASSASKLPLIAIMAATTTRRVKDPSTKNMALFTYMLPSLIRSLDCGYRYEYVLGYDKGDAFYDSEEGMAEVRKWWKSNVEDPLSGNGIKISLRLVRVNNTLKKPGPVFNEMARSAYQAGADYFYRVNDDTELMANWPDKFVKALHTLPRPYGALGPVCHQGNQKILTHDFVSRLHMEIFEMNYYPPDLTDWWMDDWISFVYGKSRTFKAAHVPVIHHTGAHGQRYDVASEHEALLGPLIASGRQKIRQWMLRNNVPEEQLVAFDNDVYEKGFQHNDIPE